MVNYQQGKIYKIVCNITGLVYIGSTCEMYLSKRLSKHVSTYKQYLNGKYPYVSSFEIIKNENYAIILIEYCHCNNSDELRMRERFHVESQECVNIFKPIQFIKDVRDYQKQFREKNKEKDKLRFKKYRDENKQTIHKYYTENIEKINIQRKKYHAENREKINIRMRENYHANKESINFKRREKRRLESLYLEQLKYYNL